MVCYAASLQYVCANSRCLLQISLEAPRSPWQNGAARVVLSHSNERPAIYSLPPETEASLRDAAAAFVRTDWDTEM